MSQNRTLTMKAPGHTQQPGASARVLSIVIFAAQSSKKQGKCSELKPGEPPHTRLWRDKGHASILALCLGCSFGVMLLRLLGFAKDVGPVLETVCTADTTFEEEEIAIDLSP